MYWGCAPVRVCYNVIVGDDETDDIILEVRERKWRQNSLEVCICSKLSMQVGRKGGEGERRIKGTS